VRTWLKTLSPPQLGYVVAVAALALDQAWKVLFLYGFGWIETLGKEGNGFAIEVLPFFDIVMIWNKGISYGLLQAESAFERWLLAIFALAVTGFLIWWLRGIKDTRLALSLGLIIGGALGNVIDRILYGAVADFFYLHAFDRNIGWYVFNLADTAVVCGVAIMVLDLVLNEWRSRKGGAKEDQT
jgi:signal peptidase II